MTTLDSEIMQEIEADMYKKPKVGFEFGDQVEEILGARMIDGELHLYCAWFVFNPPGLS